MTAFDGSRIPIGPGTLYAAPIGTTEPTSVTGAWPAGWVELGYTDAGSTFSYQQQTAAVAVEEEVFPVRNVVTGVTASLGFALAETTRQNLLLALNAGIGSSLVSGTTGVGADASIWAEPPAVGTEVRVMLGWDALEKGDTGSGATDPKALARLIARQCFQTGNISLQARKGNNKRLYACTFSLEKPAGVQPFRLFQAPQMAN